jgi:hypothetical protein
MTDKVLAEHGTQLMALKPSSIWAAAMEDLKRREHNREDNGRPDRMKQYAFHRAHVEKAQTANDIIRAAIADIQRDGELIDPKGDSPGRYASKGRASGKSTTRLIYSDVRLLQAALQ